MGHQVTPWHNVDPAHLDDDKSFFGNVQNQFEKEANFFSAEVIFQGYKFRSRPRYYSASFDAIYYLADQHGASRQATAWRYVEEQDKAIALEQYYPRVCFDKLGSGNLRTGKPFLPKVFYERSQILNSQVPSVLAILGSIIIFAARFVMGSKS